MEGCGPAGWETTSDAEFVALTQLQADGFITSDSELARAVSELVEVAPIDGADALTVGVGASWPRLGQRAGMSPDARHSTGSQASCSA